MTESRFVPEVRQALMSAGWHEGRCVADSVQTWENALVEFGAMSEAARVALQEFGGLRFDDEGPGLEQARSPFVFNPLLASGEDDRFQAFESVAGKLFPLGDYAHGHLFLAISPDGQVFALELEIYRAGVDINDAIDRLVLGRRMEMIEV